MKGGTTYGQCTVHRRAGPPHGVPGFDEFDARRVSAAGPALRGGFPRADGRVAPRWETPDCPLPTPEDRLFFLLTSLKTYALQVVQGRLFGMGQSKANQWMHVLLPVLLVALRALGDAPTRSLTALAQRLGVSETDAATVVAPLAEELVPLTAAPAVVPASPLVPMTERNGVLSAPKTLLHRPHVRAARQRTIQSTMSCSSMPSSPSSS